MIRTRRGRWRCGRSTCAVASDDEAARLAARVCTSGGDPATMRTLTAGLLTAFFRGTLQGDAAVLDLLSDEAAAPTEVFMEVK